MLHRLSIRYKIGLIALIGFLGFVILQAASYRLSINIRHQLETIVTQDFSLLKFANDVQVDFSNLDELYQAALAEADMDTLIEADSEATQMKLQFERMKRSFSISDPLFIELQTVFTDYVDRTSKHTAAVLANSLDYERTLQGYTEIGLLRERYEQTQNKLLEERYQAFEKQLIFIEEEEAYLVRFGLILGFFLTLILLTVSFFIIRNLLSAFNNAVTVAEQIASGNLNQSITSVAADETGQLMRSLHAMRDALKNQSDENQHREKVQSFLAGLNETMRGDQSLETLNSAILAYLVQHFHAQLGAVFIFSESEELHRVASYAYPTDANIKDSFKLGESMVGQAALEKRPQILNNVPDNYVQVSSGLGHSSPQSIMLIPILLDGRLKGLIELAAFNPFSDNDLYLLRRCNDAIAIALNSAQARVQMSSMLELEQLQAGELENQRQTLAETNKALAERSQELDKQNNQLEQSRSALFEKSQALEISGRYKSQFLSTMSHELRTPLNSILILSEALVENREKTLSDNQVKHANVINSAGEDLLTLINDILDLSKVEEGKMEVVIDDIETQHFSEKIIQLFEYLATEKSLAFSVEIDEDVPAHFYTDEHRLTQIIKNFISNALKFTDEGAIRVNIAKANTDFIPPCDDLTTDDYIEIVVKDTGLGIALENQKMVFEAFKQADGTTSRKHGGTGLGLTISMELAHLLGGEIILHSQGENQGSEFALILPIGHIESVNAVRLNQHNVIARKTPVIADIYDDIIDPVLSDIIYVSTNTRLISTVDEAVLRDSKQTHLKINTYADIDQLRKINDNILSRLLFIDAENLNEDGWLWLENYISKKQVKYGVLVISAQASLEKRVESLGAIFLDNKLLLKADKAAHRALIFIQYLLDNKNKRVLVVEDNPVFNEVIRALFNKNDVPLIIAKTGSQALNLLRNANFSSLIVDLNLPDYNDVALLSRIRSLEHYQSTHITVFTAEDLTPDRLRKIHDYANQVVVKSPQAIADICLQAKQILQQQCLADMLFVPQAQWQQHQYKKGQLQGVSVLLVDDDERNLYSVSQALEHEGMVVETAVSGQQALKIMADNEQLKIVLLDIMMPMMDGYQVLTTLRNSPVLPQLPVIALTAKAMLGDKEKCLAAGASAYLSKPIDMQTLFTCIASHILQEQKILTPS